MINSAIISLMGTSYDADAQLYFNQLSVQPSAAFKSAVNTLVLTLKADGNWTTLDRLWIHAAEVQQHARVSLVNPTSTAITEVNSPTWTANQGYTGNGSNMYLNSNFNPFSNGVNFIQGTAYAGAYIRNNVNAVQCALGCTQFNGSNTADTTIFPRSGGNMYSGLNSNNGVSGLVGAATDSSGFISSQSASGTLTGRRNTTSIGTHSNVNFRVPNANVYILANHSIGSPASYSTHQISITVFGGAVTHSTFYTAIQTFATTRGFNV